MATVGNLNVNVNARTAKFNKKMKSARATISRFASGIAGVAKRMAQFAVVAGTVAVAAIAAMTKAGLASVDALAKLAQSINSSVAAIQTLQHMATIGGVSIEKMDKSISKMVKNVGEVSMGIGTATDALKELGLDSKNLEKMRPDEMFGTIADALNKIPTAARRSSLAYDIFGRAGQELLVTMQGGSQAIDEMREKLENLGVIIGDEQAQMVEKANDAWADIGLVWKGLQQQLAVNFAPILTKIAEAIIKFVQEFGGMGKVAEFIVKAFMYAGALVLDVIKIMRIGWEGFQAGVLMLFGVIVEGIGIATSSIVNVWHKGMSQMQLSAGSFLEFWGKGMGIAADLVDDSGIGGEWTDKLRTIGWVTEVKGGEWQGTGAADMLKDYKSEFGEFMQLVGQDLQEQGTDHAEEILDLLADGWSMGKVPDAFEQMILDGLGSGFEDLESDLDIAAPDIKGAAETLQTALGGFKVEGDMDSRRLDKQINIEESQLEELKRISSKIATTGGMLT